MSLNMVPISISAPIQAIALNVNRMPRYRSNVPRKPLLQILRISEFLRAMVTIINMFPISTTFASICPNMKRGSDDKLWEKYFKRRARMTSRDVFMG
ncbi:MAG: hypothetical protein QXH24_03095 [Candidatus Bathyarchaeia archaeon]